MEVPLIVVAFIAGVFLTRLYSIAFKNRKRKSSKQFAVNTISETRNLSEVAQRFDLAVSAANIVMWSWDTNTKAVEFSEELFWVLGYKAEKFSGRKVVKSKIGDLIDPACTDEVEKAYEAHIKGTTEWFVTEPRVKNVDGEYVDVLVRGKIVERDKRDRPIRLEGVLLDITARKTIERELINSRKEAENIGANLARALEQAKILNSQARVADAVKTRFLMNMSHELRTPLTSIMGWTDVLLESELDEASSEQLEFVRQSSEHLLTIINSLLDVSKIQVGKMSIEGEDFDLIKMLDELALHFGYRAAEKGIELVVRIGPSVPRYIKGDRGRLNQSLGNIIDNAIKFTHNGNVVLDVSTENEIKSEVMLQFKIRDSGVGIPSEQFENIFDSFTQVDDSTTRRHGGTGIGLSIAKSFVEAMGGKIELDSTMDVGTCVSFGVSFEKQDRRQSVARIVPQQFSGKRMLIVDDNEASLEVLQELGGIWGFTVDSVNSAQGALEKLTAADSDERFDVVLLDEEMPGSGGELIAAMIRVEPSIKDTNLVFMSSPIRRKSEGTLSKAGFDGVVVKPVTGPRFYECLEKVCSRKTRLGIGVEEGRKKVSDTVGMRVLVVEDNEINREMIVVMIKSIGHKVDGVSSGEEALIALHQIAYDLVFMDIQMPIMDGLQATRKIRDRKTNIKNNSVPVVALTAHASEDDRRNCFEVGMNDFLTKPMTTVELKDIIRKWGENEVFREKKLPATNARSHLR